ncbi:hypothetical protein [Actinokineospora pegani]|uniref:hypothetical protein n=1 Tax=Actinokineospora pegani TaxID=2654637 RepID=UPI0012E9C235|nr:hypothetical protein [Actinokineospora pegani]
MRNGIALVAAGLALTGGVLAGCAVPTRGTPVAIEPLTTRTTSAPPEADPDDVRWMERFCGSGRLLITAAETTQQPTTSDDPAVLRKQFLDVTDRFVGVLDAALSDLNALVPSPAPEIDPNLRKLVDGMTEARTSMATARDTVRAADPLTAEAYRGAIDEFGAGMRGFETAVSAVNNIDLPERLVDAAGQTRSCTTDGKPAPPTTR